MTNEQTSDHGQVSETTSLDEDQVQGGVHSEGEPPAAAIRDQDGPPDAELSPDERTDADDPEAIVDPGEVDDDERPVGWADE